MAGVGFDMYARLAKSEQRNARWLLNAVAFHSAVWPVVLPLAFAALLLGFGGPAALDFLGDAAADLSGPVARLWLLCFFGAAFCYGIGPRLTGFLQHRSLPPAPIARYTQSVALAARDAVVDGIAALAAGAPHHHWTALTRPSRVALSTASDLAGSAPRLE